MKVASIVAMVCIAALQLFAIYKGVDSNFFWLSVAAIAGLGGYVVNQQGGKQL